MPVRTYELVIHNRSTRDLTLYDTHLCWGDWRPTGPPPDIIPAGGTGSIRAESGGPTSGTTGWVKYQFSPGDVISAADPPIPLPDRYTLSVAWDNPFIAGLFGEKTTFGLGVSAAPDIPVDCVHLKPKVVPQVGIPTAKKDSVKNWVLVEGDRSQDAAGDGDYWSEYLVSAGLTFYGAGYLGEAIAAWGFLEITPHPVVQLTFAGIDFPAGVTSTALPAFVPMTPVTLGPIAGVDGSFWTESWHAQLDGKRVRVDLTRQANGKLQCAVDEHVIAPDYKRTFNDLEPFLAGATDFAGDQWDPKEVPRVALVQHPVGHNKKVVLWPRNGNAAGVAGAKNALAQGGLVRLEHGPLVQQLRATQRIRLGDDGILDSYSVYSQGTPVSKRLRYVRYNSRYSPACDVMLDDIHIA